MLLADTDFWVGVSVAVFLGLAVYVGLRPVLRGLDSRAERIRRQIEEAEQLRDEAQHQLAEYKRKQRESQREAEEIVEHAKTQARRMRERAEQDLEAQLKRREALTIEKIEQAEQKALQEVRERAVDVAVAATERILREHLSDKKSDDLIDQAIQDVSKRLH